MPIACPIAPTAEVSPYYSAVRHIRDDRRRCTHRVDVSSRATLPAVNPPIVCDRAEKRKETKERERCSLPAPRDPSHHPLIFLTTGDASRSSVATVGLPGAWKKGNRALRLGPLAFARQSSNWEEGGLDEGKTTVGDRSLSAKDTESVDNTAFVNAGKQPLIMLSYSFPRYIFIRAARSLFLLLVTIIVVHSARDTTQTRR